MIQIYNPIFEKNCGKFSITVNEVTSLDKVSHYELMYYYAEEQLRYLNFGADKKQTAIDTAAHIYDAIERFRECIVPQIAVLASRI